MFVDCNRTELTNMSPMASLKWYLSYWFLQFELLTATYMLEPWEKRLFNSIVVALVAMSTYTTYVFLPRYTRSVLTYFGYDNEASG